MQTKKKIRKFSINNQVFILFNKKQKICEFAFKSLDSIHLWGNNSIIY